LLRTAPAALLLLLGSTPTTCDPAQHGERANVSQERRGVVCGGGGAPCC
jgi:hypothetical protein